MMFNNPFSCLAALAWAHGKVVWYPKRLAQACSLDRMAAANAFFPWAVGGGRVYQLVKGGRPIRNTTFTFSIRTISMGA